MLLQLVQIAPHCSGWSVEADDGIVRMGIIAIGPRNTDHVYEMAIRKESCCISPKDGVAFPIVFALSAGAPVQFAQIAGKGSESVKTTVETPSRRSFLLLVAQL